MTMRTAGRSFVRCACGRVYGVLTASAPGLAGPGAARARCVLPGCGTPVGGMEPITIEEAAAAAPPGGTIRSLLPEAPESA